jgi:hypothetical protein
LVGKILAKRGVTAMVPAGGEDGEAEAEAPAPAPTGRKSRKEAASE